jgi:hypothetical protein|tara:strand:- start:174 stop:590 length:417 start_codon:yes stop_codon:yes gene_type:complete
MSLSKARQLAKDLGTVGISSGGTNIASTVANINFVGAGNTFAVNGTTVDVSIEGGGGTKAGEAINYPSGTKSPFILNTAVISESITLNDANTVNGIANVVTGESMLTVDDNVTITVEEGKKVIPDLFNVFDTPTRFEN